MMGTGDFAVPTFRALYDAPHRVVALVTQPERPARGRQPPPVNRIKEIALGHHTPVLQPENVNSPESLAALRGLNADLFVVAAYGQILSAELLAIPPRGAINVHASLLPRYRGASPVAYAILQGEQETGVSIIGVEPRLDAGPIFGMVRTPIGPQETAGDLEDRLAQLGAPLTVQVIEAIAAGSATGLPQDSRQTTRAPKLKKEMGEIDWARPAVAIDCHVRGMQPWPGAFTHAHFSNRPPLRVLLSAVLPRDAATPPNCPPGQVVWSDQTLIVNTGGGVLEIARIQPEGKRVMSAAEFLRGYPLRAGDHFGPALAASHPA